MKQTNSSIIEVENLCYQVKAKGETKSLLDSVSLKISSGERIAILGANGAGKTTLIRCLLGLIPSQKNEVKLNGRDLSEHSRSDIAKLISYVPQQLPDNIPFTVIEFIMMSRYAHSLGGIGTGSKDSQGEIIAQEVIQRLELTHLTHQPISTLSGGEKQKVNIAAALAQQAPIIILDEPSSHLDPKQRDSIQRLLNDISRETTIITITHDLNWAAMSFNRIIGMLDTRVAIDTDTEQFITPENLHLIFGTSWPIQTHPETGKPMVLI